MIKNDALNEVVDLNHRWECLIKDLWNDVFDYDFFKLLAVHTFAFLFPYHNSKKLPREIIGVLLKIREFSSYPASLSSEHNYSILVADSFCLQMEKHWVSIDGVFSENEFVIFGYDDTPYIIDANTFDLSHLIHRI